MEISHKDKKRNKSKHNPNSKRDIIDSIITNDLKSIEKSKQLIKFIVELFKDFVKYSEGYNNKLSNILSKISHEELSKKKISEEGDIEILSYIQNIFSMISDKIIKMVNTLNEDIISRESEKYNKSDNLNNILNKKNEYINKYQKNELLNDLLHSNYYKEFSNYEEFLIKKHLGLIDQNTKNPKEKKDKDKKNKDNNNNNIEKVKEAEQTLLKQINTSNTFTQKLLKTVFMENYSNQLKIFNYSDSFLVSINEVFLNGKESIVNDFKKVIEKGRNSNEPVEKRFEKEYNKLLFNIKCYPLKCLSNEEKEKSEKIKGLNYEKLSEIIEEIKSNELRISEEDNIKIEEINNKLYIQKNIELLFDEDYGKNEDEIKEQEYTSKKKILNLFKLNKVYRKTFIQYLNNKRASGQLKLNKKAGDVLGYYFINLNNFAVNEKDYYSFKIITVLSVTYYCTENNSDKKIYMAQYTQNCYEFINKQFWNDYLKDAINKDLEVYEEYEKPITEYSYDETKNLKSQKIHFCIYSNIFSLVKIMMDFNLKKEFIIEWLNDLVNNIFYIDETEKNEILNLLNTGEN